jgi:hypothetical protein
MLDILSALPDRVCLPHQFEKKGNRVEMPNADSVTKDSEENEKPGITNDEILEEPIDTIWRSLYRRTEGMGNKVLPSIP